MAPARGAQAQGARQAARLPRDHPRGDSPRARAPARGGHGARRGARGAPRARPPVRVRGLAGAVAQGRARPVRGSRAVRSRSRLVVDRERERMAFVGRRVLGRHRAVFEALAGRTPAAPSNARLTSVDGTRVATGRDFDDTGTLKGRRRSPTSTRGRRQLAAGLAGSAVPGERSRVEAVHPSALGALHHLHPASKRRAASFAWRPRSHARGAGTVRARVHHVHAYRLADRCRAKRSTPPAPGRRSSTAPTPSPSAAHVRSRRRGAQEAHEAIRPAGRPLPHARLARNELVGDEWQLYDLIWKRTVA